MTTVGILIFEDVEVLDFCGPFEVFSVTRPIGVPTTDETNKPFEVFLVAERPEIVKARGNLLVQPHYTIDNHPPIDVLVVPGVQGTRREVSNRRLIDWIAEVAGQASLRTSVCTGSFLLAEAGILDGRRATTHWASLDRKRLTYPQVTVLDGRRFVDEGNVLTSAGISAGIDLALHLVERLLGREVAEQTARTMEYDWHRDPSGAARPAVPA